MISTCLWRRDARVQEARRSRKFTPTKPSTDGHQDRGQDVANQVERGDFRSAGIARQGIVDQAGDEGWNRTNNPAQKAIESSFFPRVVAPARVINKITNGDETPQTNGDGDKDRVQRMTGDGGS